MKGLHQSLESRFAGFAFGFWPEPDQTELLYEFLVEKSSMPDRSESLLQTNPIKATPWE
jgi:hypothetical protein